MTVYKLPKTKYDSGTQNENPEPGFYTFQIIDYKEKTKEGYPRKTKNGDPSIIVVCEVVDTKEEGKKCIHNVVFYKETSPSIKGIVLTRHFLKCIDEPNEGDLEVNPDNWIGKRFLGEVVKNGEYINIVNIERCDQCVTKSSTVSAGGSKQMITEERNKAIDNNEIAWDS